VAVVVVQVGQAVQVVGAATAIPWPPVRTVVAVVALELV